MWIDIFRSGKQTDSKGRTEEFTNEDLDRMVESYDPKDHEAPVVIGHPKNNSPAWGWVEGLKRSGDILQAKLKDLAPEFSGWLKEKRYKKRSISLYPDGTVRHIGFLGAMPPAVKGLEDVAFSDMDFTEYEFTEHSLIADTFRRLREWIIEKFGKEEADKVVSNWEIEVLGQSPEVEEGTVPVYGEEEKGQRRTGTVPVDDNTNKKEGKTMSDKTYTEVELKAAIEKEKEEFSEKTASLNKAKKEAEDALKAKDKELADFKRENRKKELKTFCESLKKEGKLTPAEEKMGVIEFMEALEDIEGAEIEFSEGGKKTPSEWFKDYLTNRGKVIELREIAGGGKDIPATDEAKRERLISDYMEANKCDYKVAMLEVSKEHPGLF